MKTERNLILTICTGNTCRSPMAEKLLQHALAAEGEPLNQLTVASAGVAAGEGSPASKICSQDVLLRYAPRIYPPPNK
jgi:protein-tyrosine phosphatase